jgi:hypothetical protein
MYKNYPKFWAARQIPQITWMFLYRSSFMKKQHIRWNTTQTDNKGERKGNFGVEETVERIGVSRKTTYRPSVKYFHF